MKNINLFFGIGLLIVSLISLCFAFFETAKYVYVDYPCRLGLGPRLEVKEGTRIWYCINLWPRNAVSGGIVYAYGSSNENRVIIPRQGIVPTLFLERQNDILIVNGHILNPKERYDRFLWQFSWNIWLIFTANLTIQNGGLIDDVLQVYGDIEEGWLPQPLGIILTILAILLILKGSTKIRNDAS